MFNGGNRKRIAIGVSRLTVDTFSWLVNTSCTIRKCGLYYQSD